MVDVVRRQGGRVSIDASSTGVLTDIGVAEAKRRFAELRPDVFFANADEATMLDLVDWPGAVVVKRGPDPVEVIVDGRHRTVPVPALESGIDTTGAGDAFAGGFLAAWTIGVDVDEAAVGGVASAVRLLRTRAPIASPS
jgi:sugar/nucleoside kinase (ribokinase family)